MELQDIQDLIEKIRGCTFASLDATTEPSPGIKIVTTGLRVMLFASQQSGYEAMVKRRLTAIGKDPESFHVGGLPWGERLGNFPIIVNKGRHYLQTIPISGGVSQAFIGSQEVDIESIRQRLRLSHNDPSQGLPPGLQVKVRCYNLASIDALRLMGEEVTA